MNMLSLNVLMLRRATLIGRKRDRVRARQIPIPIWGGVEVRRTGGGVDCTRRRIGGTWRFTADEQWADLEERMQLKYGLPRRIIQIAWMACEIHPDPS